MIVCRRQGHQGHAMLVLQRACVISVRCLASVCLLIGRGCFLSAWRWCCSPHGYSCNPRRSLWTSSHALVPQRARAACCKYTRWFRRTLLQCEGPVYELLATPRKFQQLLRFRLGCHALSSATGQRRNPHVPRDQRERTKLQHIRDRYARLFDGFDTMRSFVNQASRKDVMNFISECLECLRLRCATRWRGPIYAAEEEGTDP